MGPAVGWEAVVNSGIRFPLRHLGQSGLTGIAIPAVSQFGCRVRQCLPVDTLGGMHRSGRKSVLGVYRNHWELRAPWLKMNPIRR